MPRRGDRFVDRLADRRDDERGAVAIVAAAVLVLVMVIAALTVDLGMQRVARRDMQAVADLVALDLSRLVDGRTAQRIRDGGDLPGDLPGLEEARVASVERNGGDAVGEELEVDSYLVDLDSDGEYLDENEDGVPDVELRPTDRPDAVVVVARTTVGFGFAPVFGVGEGDAVRTAVGTNGRSACFTIGSYARAFADADAGDLVGPLNRLLGLDRVPGAPDLDLDDYLDLAGATVTLSDVAARPQIGSPSALLGTARPLTGLLGAMAGALADVPTPDPASASAAAAVLDRIGTVLRTDPTVRVSDVVAVDPQDLRALETEVIVLDLLAGVVLGEEDRDLDLAGLPAGADADVTASQGLQRVCGRPGGGTATASEVEADLETALTFGSTGFTDVRISGEAAVRGGLGGGEAQLAAPPRVYCGDRAVPDPDDPDTYGIDVDAGGTGFGTAVRVEIDGVILRPELDDVVDGLGRQITRVQFRGVELNRAEEPEPVAPTDSVVVTVPGNTGNAVPAESPAQTGRPVGALPASTPVSAADFEGEVRLRIRRPGQGPLRRTVSLENAWIRDRVTDPLLAQVNGVVGDQVDEGLVGSLEEEVQPLVRLFGLRAGGADVYSVARPTCVGVRLAG